MEASNKTLSFERTPLEGVPGLRAAGFRLVYRLLMRLKPGLDRRKLLQDIHSRLRQRQRLWDSAHPCVNADRAVTLLIVFLIGLGLNTAFYHKLHPDSTDLGSGRIMERTRVPFRLG